MSDQSPHQPGYQPPNQPSPYAQALPYASWQQPVVLKHSGVGIASFILGISMVVLELALIVLAAVLVQQHQPSSSPSMEIAGCTMILGLLACVVGVVLGIVGALQRDRRKLFAILGLCVNGLILLGVVGLFLIGVALKK